MRRALVALLVATACVTAGVTGASADVLVSYPGKYVTCGDQIEVGVWYQAYSGGPQWARITISNMRGRVVRRINTTAVASHWRYWTFYGACGHQYKVKYDVPFGSSKWRVQVGY
jgi:hypothetical protein